MINFMNRMKTINPLIIVLSFYLSFLLISPTIAQENSWISKSPMPTARGGSGVAVVDDKIYVIGGSTESGLWPSINAGTIFGFQEINNFVGVNEVYDPVSDTWETKEQMPTARGVFSIAVYQNKIYCIGGKTNDGISAVNEVYDPLTDTWETKSPIPSGVFESEGNVVDDKIFVIDYSGPNYAYDPTDDSWSTRTDMPNEAFNYASAVIDENIFVFSGFSSNLTQIYNTETDTWSLGVSTLSVVSGGATGITTGVMAPNSIYLLGYPVPVSVGAPLYYTQIYHPENETWQEGTAMPTKRVGFGVAVIQDTIYAIGGHTHDTVGYLETSNVNEQYIPIGYIPEFPSEIILPLTISIGLVVIIFKKRFKN